MKRLLVLALLVAMAGTVLYLGERYKAGGHVGPEGALNATAELQREVSRVPARITRISDRQEILIGNQMAQQYSTTYSEADAPMQAYVDEVGRRVAAHTRRKLEYKFHYIPQGYLVNAFALPGGQIFIGKGLIDLMESEDELASVLGHEVEHVEHYHCNERASIEAAARHLPLGGLIVLPVELFQAGYNKEQELEADRDGTQLAVLAGYSPQGAVRMFQAFEKLEHEYVTKDETPDQELSRVAIQSITGYFRSHPLSAERERQIKLLTVSQRWPEPKEKPLKITVKQTASGD